MPDVRVEAESVGWYWQRDPISRGKFESSDRVLNLPGQVSMESQRH